MVTEQCIAPCLTDACAEPLAISWKSHESLQDVRIKMKGNVLQGKSFGSRSILQDRAAIEVLGGGFVQGALIVFLKVKWKWRSRNMCFPH